MSYNLYQVQMANGWAKERLIDCSGRSWGSGLGVEIQLWNSIRMT